jgi:threonyl-tRNA synthetase
MIRYNVRLHSLAKVPIILAIGKREVNERTLTVRKLGEKHTETLEFDQVILELKKECVPPDIR